MRIKTRQIIVASTIGLFLVGVFSAKYMIDNANNKRILGLWSCEVDSGHSIDHKGTLSFDRTGRHVSRMRQKKKSDLWDFDYKLFSVSEYEVEGNLLKTFGGRTKAVHLTTAPGNSESENKEFRKRLENSLNLDIGEIEDGDGVMEIAFISKSELILTPEGGGSAQINCRK